MPESVRANVSIALDDAFEPFSTFSKAPQILEIWSRAKTGNACTARIGPSPMKPRMFVWPTTTMDGVIQRPV